MISKQKVSKKVTTPSEYREAVNAAETLGLELKTIRIYGYGWQTEDGRSINASAIPPMKGETLNNFKAHRKYFETKIDGDRVKFHAARSPESLDEPVLTLGFS